MFGCTGEAEVVQAAIGMAQAKHQGGLRASPAIPITTQSAVRCFLDLDPAPLTGLIPGTRLSARFATTPSRPGTRLSHSLASATDRAAQ